MNFLSGYFFLIFSYSAITSFGSYAGGKLLLSPSCLNDIDDRSTLVQGGKARYVEEFMNDIGAELLHDGYQIVWRI